MRGLEGRSIGSKSDYYVSGGLWWTEIHSGRQWRGTSYSAPSGAY